MKKDIYELINASREALRKGDTQMKPLTKKAVQIISVVSAVLILMLSLAPSIFAAQTAGLTSGKLYNIKNRSSGKYLNVTSGTDRNGTNIMQWSKDGSVEQKFKLEYLRSPDCYRLLAVCSSNGGNRALDVARKGGKLVSGCNVDIWAPNDNAAQYLKIVDLKNGYYKIVLKSNQKLALTAYGKSNGTGAGKTSTSGGNVYVSTYSGANNQQWSFQEVSPAAPPMGGDGIPVHLLYRPEYGAVPDAVIAYAKEKNNPQEVDAYIKRMYAVYAAKSAKGDRSVDNELLKFMKQFHISQQAAVGRVSGVYTEAEFKILCANNQKDMNRAFVNSSYCYFSELDGKIYPLDEICKMSLTEIQQKQIDIAAIKRLLSAHRNGVYDYSTGKEVVSKADLDALEKRITRK
jgi:hypothetical protein